MLHQVVEKKVKSARLHVRECTYLGALRLVEGRAAEGVGDERGPRRRVCAGKLHAVGHPRPSGLEAQHQHRSYSLECTCARAEIVPKLERSHLIEKGGPVLVVVEAGNVLTNSAARGRIFRRDVDLILKRRQKPVHICVCFHRSTRGGFLGNWGGSHWLAVGGAVGAAGAEQVEAAGWVQAAAALAAVAQAAVVMLHQRLTGSQHATVAEHTHGLAH